MKGAVIVVIVLFVADVWLTRRMKNIERRKK